MENYYLDFINLGLNLLLVIGIAIVIYIKNKSLKVQTKNYQTTMNALEAAFIGEQRVSKDWRDLYFNLKNHNKTKLPFTVSFHLDLNMINKRHIIAMGTLMVKKGFTLYLINDGSLPDDLISEILLKMRLDEESLINITTDDVSFILNKDINIHFSSNPLIVDLINKQYPTAKPSILVT
jgi:hypothetical protein